MAKVVNRSSGVEKKYNMPNKIFTTDYDILNDDTISMMIGLTGIVYSAKDIILSAFDKGKYVVTANKALIAKYAKELFTKYSEKKVIFKFEAAVWDAF
ncbi:hypothetical protein ACFLY8_04440 [Halobacteriota archaeon]